MPRPPTTPRSEIPSSWGKSFEEEKQTRTGLIQKRRQERIPDLSFDLDGDGLVGNRDYVIAKLFDKDQDGKLNAQERKAALEALSNVRAQPCLTRCFPGVRGEVRLGRRAERRAARLPHHAEGTRGASSANARSAARYATRTTSAR